MDLLYSYSGEISKSSFLLTFMDAACTNFNSVNLKGEINLVSPSYM